MKRVRMVVAYDGTAYRGWQLQPNGITIEQVLNRELTALLKEPISVIGASRTDSGVHARGNVAVFDTENRMPADKICLSGCSVRKKYRRTGIPERLTVPKPTNIRC